MKNRGRYGLPAMPFTLHFEHRNLNCFWKMNSRAGVGLVAQTGWSRPGVATQAIRRTVVNLEVSSDMAKFKPAGSHKPVSRNSNRGLIPCAILILSGFAFLSFLFYEILKSGVK